MNKFIKYTDFMLLRLIPTIFLLFLLYSDMRDSLQAFNRIENYSFLLFLESFSIIMCFVFFGLTSVLRTFKVSVKFSVWSRYGACAMALIRVFLYVSAQIESVGLGHSPGLTLKFFDSIFEIQQVLYIISFLIITISCFIKDKFFKTKWILTTLCLLSFLLASFHAPLYTLINYDMVSFRLLFSSFLFSYCYCAVIITGLAPSTIKA